MAIIKIYTDTQRLRPDGRAPIKISISHNSVTRYVSLNMAFLPNVEWDPENCIVKRTVNGFRELTFDIEDKLQLATDVARLYQIKHADCSARDLKIAIQEALFPTKKVDATKLFAYRLRKFANQHSATTKSMYLHTLTRMQQYAGDAAVGALSFEDINKDWLTDFENYLAQTACKNARNIHLRNIRAVFNDAIDDEITTAYPFRKFKIKPEPTRKRAISLEALRALFDYDVEPWQEEYRDMFKLTFFLIGINIVDLCHLKEVVDGRIEYTRAKTHRKYSIKVEPEAMEIINRYRGERWLLPMLDRYSNYQDYRHHMNDGLKAIGKMTRSGRGGKKHVESLVPGISTYYARHTWATVARSIGISIDDIALALGHGDGHALTHIYLDEDFQRVDEANRRVIDWVLYGKK